MFVHPDLAGRPAHHSTAGRELLQQGYTILRGAAPASLLCGVAHDLEPRFAATPFCEGGFYGERTKRFGRLLVRSPLMGELVMHREILDLAELALGNWCDRIQLNLSQAIELHPGALPQFPHRDQDMWQGALGDVEYLINVMWPLTPFRDAGASDAVDMLADEAAFLNLEGEAIWTDEAVWLDSEPLADAFGTALNDRLVRFPNVARAAVARLFSHLGVAALSDVARFRLAREPDGRPAEEATRALRERADLLLWLAPNRATRHAMREILEAPQIRLSADLSVQAEIEAFDPPVRSADSSVPAYFDADRAILHLRSASDRVDWAAAFRTLFGEVERFCPTTEIPPLCLTATLIMLHEDRLEAEHQLRISGFHAPESDDVIIDVGHELADAPDCEPDDVASEGDEAVEDADTVDVDRTVDGGEIGDGNGGDDGIAPMDEASATSSAPGGADDDVEMEAEDDPLRNAATDDHGSQTIARPEDDSGGGDGTGDAGRAFGAVGFGERRNEGSHAEDRAVGDHLADDVDSEHMGGVGSGSGEAIDEEDLTGDTYGSAPGRGAFGVDPADPADPDEGGRRGGTTATGHGTGSPYGVRDYAARDRSAERQARRSRMLTYVSRASRREEANDGAASEARDLADQIDAAAMKAAMQYEEEHGREAERQPHFNKGYDIVSRSSDGGRRIIEVKGLEDEWTERGIKLSHSQFDTAREYPGEFWIYIVEYARDNDRQRVTALANPFGKVEEYWFDHGWRDFSEERATSRNIRLMVGLRVEHPTWGTGTVVEIKSRGLIPEVVVDFGKIEGRRGIPFNASLRLVD